MPPRRKERRLEPYFTPSGVGKLFYEPADGPQQARQREQKDREFEFGEILYEVGQVHSRPDPAESTKIRARVEGDAPPNLGGVNIAHLARGFAGDRGRSQRFWELGQAAGLPTRELMARDVPAITPGRFSTPGNWAAPSSAHPSRTTQQQEQMLAHEVSGRAQQGHVRKVLADNARMLSRTTVPVEDVSGLSEVQFGGRPPTPNVAGLSEDAVYGRLGGPKISVFDGHRGKLDTLVHEIGHHVSHKDPNRPVSRMERGHHPDLGAVFPEEEAFADDYAIEHTGENRSSYESHLSDDSHDTFSPRYAASRRHPLRSEEFASGSQDPAQLEIFETETAFAPEADTEVQAYTRDEGREVIGWGPNPSPHRPHVQKHRYPTAEERLSGAVEEFHGANYVTYFNDDVIPERRMEYFEEARYSRRPELKPKQTWKDR